MSKNKKTFLEQEKERGAIMIGIGGNMYADLQRIRLGVLDAFGWCSKCYPREECDCK